MMAWRRRAPSSCFQKSIAEEVSRVTAGEYQEDIMRHMIHMESQTPPDVDSIKIQTEM